MEPIWIPVLLALVCAMAYAMWSSLHTQIATGYSYIRIAEFGIFKGLNTIWAVPVGGVLLCAGGVGRKTKRLPRIANKLLIIVGVVAVICGAVGRIFEGWFDFFWLSDKAYIEWSHILTSSLYANGLTLIAMTIPLCVWFAKRSIQTNPLNHKHFAKARDYTLHSFTDEMAPNYPHLGLFRKVGLTGKSIDVGKYRMSETEKQFAISNYLLDRAEGMNFKINRDRAAETFRGQMGGLWRSWRDLSKWEVALFGVLLPRIAAFDRDMPSDEYKAALGTTTSLIESFWRQANANYDKETDSFDMDITAAVNSIRKYVKSEQVQPYFKKHAYVYTILYAMLSDARRLGVLPPSELRWLMVVDRRLWLVIDCIGRITPFTEVAGVYCHYQNESYKKRSLDRPEVANAVKGLIDGIEAYKFSEEEEQIILAQHEKGAEAAEGIDPGQATPKARVLIFGSIRVTNATRQDFLEVALIDEGGRTVYSAVCRPEMPREDIMTQHNMSDDDIVEVMKLPMSMEIKKELLKQVNGQDVIAYYADELKLVSGIERSAKSVRALEAPNAAIGLSDYLVSVGAEPAPPTIKSAVDAAKHARTAMVHIKKAEMRAKAAAATDSQATT